MNYIKQDGQNENLIILLHGTGGDARSLMGIAERLDPDATKVGIDGDVMEMGMRRYFARYPDGRFDLESLSEATKDLYDTIEELRKGDELKDKRVILLGYSNGANILQSLLKTFETDYRLAFLLHPAPTRPEEPFQIQPDLRVLLTGGERDPYLSPDDFRKIEAKLKEAGIPTETLIHGQGHSLLPEELSAAARLIAALDQE